MWSKKGYCIYVKDILLFQRIRTLNYILSNNNSNFTDSTPSFRTKTNRIKFKKK